MTGSRRTLLLVLLIAAGVINYADRQIIAVLKPLLERDLHWSDQDYGFLTSLFQFSAAIAYLFAGWFVDRTGVRWANPLAVGAWSLAAMAHAVVRGFAQFAVARVALGASEAVNTPAAIKTVGAFWGPEQRASVLGVLNAANNLGAILTPLFLPQLTVSFGWRAAFLITGAAGLVWVAAWFALMFAKLAPGHAGSEGAADAVQARRAEAHAKVGLGALLADRRTWAILGAKALSDQVWWFLLFWTPDLFHRVFHLGLAQLGPPLALIYGLAAAGSLLGGWASSRLLASGRSLNAARKGVMLASALLVTPVVFAPGMASPWAAAGLIGLALAAHQGFSTTLFTLITDITPARRVGSVTSLGALAGNLSGMAVLAAAGVVFSRGGGYGPFFALIACAYLLALGWVQLLVPRLTPAEPAEVALA